MESMGFFLVVTIICLGVCFLVSGLDDLFFDLVYWYHFLRGHTGQKRVLDEAELTSLPEKRIALIVPCWKEKDVIGKMLDHNIRTIQYVNYDVFVGVYPNDDGTIGAVKEAQQRRPNVYMAVCPNPGPTNKADNLNGIYAEISRHCERTGTRYDIVIMHDSEDVIHPWSFRVYNMLQPGYDMVQVPVFPLKLSLKRTTYWTYCDEFAEGHTKDMHAREMMNGFVPSAGVGTGFSWHALHVLGEHYDGRPFAGSTFTEDYSSALRIRVLGLKAKFANYRVNLPGGAEHIATRALFPQVYKAAVRQKSRWSLGIVLQEWKETGWPGDFVTRYNLLHDRKSVASHFVTGFGMATFAFGVGYFGYATAHPAAHLPNIRTIAPWADWLLGANLLKLTNRLLQRGIATYRLYGFAAALLSAPRMLYGNIINLHAMVRAYQEFFPFLRGNRAMRWEKTNNVFPTTAEMAQTRKKLGEILVAQGWVSEVAVEAALAEQETAHCKLGELLANHYGLRADQLAAALLYQKSGVWPHVIKAA